MSDKTKILIIIFILLFSFHGFGQNPDSLEMALQKKLPDSTRINVLNSLGNNYLINESEQAIIKLNEAIMLAEKTENREQLAFSNILAGIYYHKVQNPKLTSTHLNYGLELFKKNPGKFTIAERLQIANAYLITGNPDESKILFQNILSESLTDPLSFVKARTGLANVYLLSDSLPQAKKELQTILDSVKKMEPGESFLINVYESLGRFHNKSNNHKASAEAYFMALELSKKFNLKFSIAWGYLNMAEELANLRKFSKAKLFLDTLIQHASKHKFIEIQNKAYQRQIAILRGSGDFKNALVSMEEHHFFRDSILKTEHLQALNEINSRYEALLKKKSLEFEEQIPIIMQLRDKNEKQFNLLKILAGISVLLIGSFAIYNYYSNRKLKGIIQSIKSDFNSLEKNTIRDKKQSEPIKEDLLSKEARPVKNAPVKTGTVQLPDFKIPTGFTFQRLNKKNFQIKFGKEINPDNKEFILAIGILPVGILNHEFELEDAINGPIVNPGKLLNRLQNKFHLTESIEYSFSILKIDPLKRIIEFSGHDHFLFVLRKKGEKGVRANGRQVLPVMEGGEYFVYEFRSPVKTPDTGLTNEIKTIQAELLGGDRPCLFQTTSIGDFDNNMEFRKKILQSISLIRSIDDENQFGNLEKLLDAEMKGAYCFMELKGLGHSC